MYQDKTLICKDCGAEFVFTAGEQQFYAEKASRTSRRDAKSAVWRAKTAVQSPREKCSPQHALPAVRKHAFRLSREKTARFIAATALQK